MPETYQHAEAYCLMTYRSEDGTEEELIWNSRDGVTPFVISLRSGAEAKHVDWHQDQRVPDYQPPPGTRIFVDLTRDIARDNGRRTAERWFADDGNLGEMARARFTSVEHMAETLAADALEHPGAPAIVEVPHA